MLMIGGKKGLGVRRPWQRLPQNVDEEEACHVIEIGLKNWSRRVGGVVGVVSEVGGGGGGGEVGCGGGGGGGGDFVVVPVS